MNWWLILLSTVVGGLRPLFIGEKNKHLSQSYQAFSHIFVGVLLFLWWREESRIAGYCLAFLIAIELVCAFSPLFKKFLTELGNEIDKFNQFR